jgi:hypothetical protein
MNSSWKFAIIALWIYFSESAYAQDAYLPELDPRLSCSVVMNEWPFVAISNLPPGSAYRNDERHFVGIRNGEWDPRCDDATFFTATAINPDVAVRRCQVLSDKWINVFIEGKSAPIAFPRVSPDLESECDGKWRGSKPKDADEEGRPRETHRRVSAAFNAHDLRRHIAAMRQGEDPFRISHEGRSARGRHHPSMEEMAIQQADERRRQAEAQREKLRSEQRPASRPTQVASPSPQRQPIARPPTMRVATPNSAVLVWVHNPGEVQQHCTFQFDWTFDGDTSSPRRFSGSSDIPPGKEVMAARVDMNASNVRLLSNVAMSCNPN